MDQITALIHRMSIFDLLDIAIVSYVVYRLILLIRGTRAVQLLKGIIILVLADGISQILHLHALNWLLTQALTIGLIAIPVVFQPELRRALEQLGRSRVLDFTFRPQEEDITIQKTVDELVRAATYFSRNRIGALIIIERATGLNEYIETGIEIGAKVTSALLINSFIPNTPLHDGAMILRGDRVIAASCYLPLSDSLKLGKELGTRHRAAVGITEQSDALALVVSEETGTISLARAGLLLRYLTEPDLKRVLIKEMSMPTHAKGWRMFTRRGDSP